MSISKNPWDSTVLQGISVGSIDTAVALARRTEHLPPHGEIERERRMPSLRMIRQQRNITKLKKEMNALELEIKDRQWDQTTADLIHLDVLEKRTRKLEELSSQLTDTLQKKEELVMRLREPFTGDHIEMDASCHKHAARLFTAMGLSVTNLGHHLEDVSWISEAAMISQELNKTLKDVSSHLTQYQTRFNELIKSRQLLQEMQKNGSYRK